MHLVMGEEEDQVSIVKLGPNFQPQDQLKQKGTELTSNLDSDHPGHSTYPTTPTLLHQKLLNIRKSQHRLNQLSQDLEYTSVRSH